MQTKNLVVVSNAKTGFRSALVQTVGVGSVVLASA